LPKDIDIAIISEKNESISINGFHISILKPKDFFINPSSIIHTLFREGYSLKHNKFFSEIYRFSNKVLFNYNLSKFENTKKVRIVNMLRGKRRDGKRK